MATHNALTLMTSLFFTLTLTLTLTTGEQNPPTGNLNSSPAASFYAALKSNGLPIGLFPKGISNFSIDPSSGQFELHLLSPSPCDAKFETLVRYEWNITGSLNIGKIANISGVAAEELFLWLPVKNIQVDIPSSGLIYFDVGVVLKQFSLSFFEIPKDCDAVVNGEEGGKDVVSVDDRGRVVGVGNRGFIEKRSEKFVRKRFTDEEQRAVS